MYRDGEGVPQDDAQAVAWCRLAADQGYARAQHNLGARYSTGRRVAQDYVEGMVWFQLALASASHSARTITATELKRDVLAVKEITSATLDLNAKKMTSAQLAKAQKRASEWQAAFDARQE